MTFDKKKIDQRQKVLADNAQQQKQEITVNTFTVKSLHVDS